MCKRSAAALAGLVFAFCLMNGVRVAAADLDQLRGFKTTQDIGAYFEHRKVPIESTELEVNGHRWFFVVAFAYSGMNTIDLYAYVWRGGSWDMFSLTYLLNSKTQKVQIKADGEFIEVVHDGIVTVRINSRKAAGALSEEATAKPWIPPFRR